MEPGRAGGTARIEAVEGRKEGRSTRTGSCVLIPPFPSPVSTSSTLNLPRSEPEHRGAACRRSRGCIGHLLWGGRVSQNRTRLSLPPSKSRIPSQQTWPQFLAPGHTTQENEAIISLSVVSSKLLPLPLLYADDVLNWGGGYTTTAYSAHPAPAS